MGFGASLIHSVICSTVFLGSRMCQALLQQETGYEQDSPSPCPVGPPGLTRNTHMNIHCHGFGGMGDNRPVLVGGLGWVSRGSSRVSL